MTSAGVSLGRMAGVRASIQVPQVTPVTHATPTSPQVRALPTDLAGTLGGRSVAEVARNIGVHEMTLGRWVRKAKDARESAVPADAVVVESERLELIRLRAQAKDDKATIAELQMQVEFAKKVATWFAKGKQ